MLGIAYSDIVKKQKKIMNHSFSKCCKNICTSKSHT